MSSDEEDWESPVKQPVVVVPVPVPPPQYEAEDGSQPAVSTAPPVVDKSKLFGDDSDDDDSDENNDAEPEPQPQPQPQEDAGIFVEQEQRNDDQETENDSVEDEQERPKRIPLEIGLPDAVRLPQNCDGKTVLQMPNFIQIEPEAYQAAKLESQEVDADAQKTVYILQHTIRYRVMENGRVQSNARLVKWSDGSMTLMVGKQHFVTVEKSLHRNNYLYRIHPKLLIFESDATDLAMHTSHSVLPNGNVHQVNIKAETLEQVPAVVDGGEEPVGGMNDKRTRFIAGFQDPQAERKRVERAEADKQRTAKRARNAGSRSKRPRLTVNMLEGGYSTGDDDSGQSSELSDIGDNVGRRTRQELVEDEYDRDFIADDEEELETYEDGEEGAGDELEAMDDTIERLAKRKPADVIEDEEDDDDDFGSSDNEEQVQASRPLKKHMVQ